MKIKNKRQFQIKDLTRGGILVVWWKVHRSRSHADSRKKHKKLDYSYEVDRITTVQMLQEIQTINFPETR